MKTETVIKTDTDDEILVQDGDNVSLFLQKLSKQIISDNTIIKFIKNIGTGIALRKEEIMQQCLTPEFFVRLGLKRTRQKLL